jgi:threonine aldolase
MNRVIDLRSDTITLPSEPMRRAMYQAEVGDDVYVEDPTVVRLEQMMAERVGMEAGLFVTSGTQGNLVALLTHCPRGAEVILEARAHIFYFEVGGLSALGGLIPVLVPGQRGVLDPEAVRQHIRAENVHFPSTGLICLENTHNRAGGTITRPEQVRAIAQVAAEHGIPLHVDGARIMNAAVALGVHPSELTAGVDSISVCLSKGLGAPVGAVLCGSKQFIAAARKYRKMLGGGLRQVGVLAAAGIYALENNVERLAEDHQNARYLAEGLQQIPGLSIDMETVQTNIIAIDVSGTGLTGPQVVQRLAAVGVKGGSPGPNTVRLVTHLNVNRDDCSEALARIQSALGR